MEWVNTFVIRAIHTFRRIGFIPPEISLKFLLLKHQVKLKFAAQTAVKGLVSYKLEEHRRTV